MLRQKDKADPQSLARLADGADKFEPDDRARLLRGLADAYLVVGKPEEARKLWNQVSELLPQDLQVRLLLFDAAMRAEDEDAMREQLRAIRRIEEADGPLGHFVAASHLFWQARKAKKDGLDEARSKLADEARSELAAAAKRRSDWDKIVLLQAAIAELEEREDQAIENYLRAVEYGNRQFEVIRRLVLLLQRNGRSDDAYRVFRRIPEQTAFSAEFQRVIAEVSLQARDWDRALEAARKAVKDNSTDYTDHLWLGQVLWVSGQTKEAEPALRRAVQLSGEKPDPWVALVQFLASTKRVKEAEAVLHEAEGKLPKQKAILAFAQCYEAIGKPEEAQKRYEDAVKAEKDNVAVRQGAANFYLRVGQRAKAEAELEEILDLENTSADIKARTRRVLAVVKAAQGDYKKSLEALELLDLGLKQPEVKAVDPEDLRAKAVVLANQRPRTQKRQAIQLLQQLAGLRTLPPEEQFLLVQLYEAVGETAKAREQMLRLLGTRGEDPRYLAHQVQMQLRQGELTDAQLWLDQLEKRASKAPRTVELKARLLKAQGEGEQDKKAEQDKKIVQLLTAYQRDNPTLPVLVVAALLENLKLGAEAEKMYLKHAAEPGKPRNALQLAEFLARQKRTREALNVCRTAWPTCPPVEVANTCTTVLRISPGSAEDIQLVRGWFEEALKKKDAPTGLLVCLAYLHDLAGDYRQAESVYREVLRREPRNIVALNNLAWVLSYQAGRGEEALQLADQAVKVVGGPLPELASTRAAALLSLHRGEDAIPILQAALDHVGLSAEVNFSLQFHLVQALHMAGRKAEAVESLKNAKVAGLDESKLHPLERPLLRQLLSEMTTP